MFNFFTKIRTFVLFFKNYLKRSQILEKTFIKMGNGYLKLKMITCWNFVYHMIGWLSHLKKCIQTLSEHMNVHEIDLDDEEWVRC